MKTLLVIVGVVVLCSCAKVQLETREPVRVDINMRVDVYQHIVKEVESIEGEIFNSKEKQFNAIFIFPRAYAQDYSDNVRAAIERRKTRITTIGEYLGKGYVGENRHAGLEMMAEGVPPELGQEIASIVSEENNDREIIYTSLAERDGVALSEVRKILFQDHYQRAPAGYWFEVWDGSKSNFIWLRK